MGFMFRHEGHGSRGLESVAVMVGSVAAGRHGAGTVAESLHFCLQAGGSERKTLGKAWVFEPQNLPPVIHFLQQGYSSSSSPKSPPAGNI